LPQPFFELEIMWCEVSPLTRLLLDEVEGCVTEDSDACNSEFKWNCWNKVPVSEWLCSSQGPEDKERMHALGNCVVPLMGKEAGFRLSQVAMLAQETMC